MELHICLVGILCLKHGGYRGALEVLGGKGVAVIWNNYHT